MTHSLLAKNAKDFEVAIGDRTAFFDINYEVISKSSRRGTVLRDESAILNAYKIWLQSRGNDYVRNPGFGGFFDNNLNDRFKFSPESEEPIKSALIEETAAKWPDIQILDATVKCVMENREWKVKVVIMDKNTRAIATEMLDLNEQGVSIRSSYPMPKI